MKNILKIILIFIIIPLILAEIIEKLMELGIIPYETIVYIAMFPFLLLIVLYGNLAIKKIKAILKDDVKGEDLYGFDREIPREEIEKHLKELNLDTSGFNLNRILITFDETRSDQEIVKEIYEKIKQAKEYEEQWKKTE